MYHMMRRRNNVGPVLVVDEPDEGDLQSFLQRFDIAKEFVLSIFHSLVSSEVLSFQSRRREHYQLERE